MNIEKMKKLQNKKTIVLQASKKPVTRQNATNIREEVSNNRTTKGVIRERHQSLIT